MSRPGYDRPATRGEHEKWVVIDTQHDLKYFFPTRALARQAVQKWNDTAGKRRYTFKRNPIAGVAN